MLRLVEERQPDLLEVHQPRRRTPPMRLRHLVNHSPTWTPTRLGRVLATIDVEFSGMAVSILPSPAAR